MTYAFRSCDKPRTLAAFCLLLGLPIAAWAGPVGQVTSTVQQSTVQRQAIIRQQQTQDQQKQSQVHQQLQQSLTPTPTNNASGTPSSPTGVTNQAQQQRLMQQQRTQQISTPPVQATPAVPAARGGG